MNGVREARPRSCQVDAVCVAQLWRTRIFACQWKLRNRVSFIEHVEQFGNPAVECAARSSWPPLSDGRDPGPYTLTRSRSCSGNDGSAVLSLVRIIFGLFLLREESLWFSLRSCGSFKVRVCTVLRWRCVRSCR